MHLSHLKTRGLSCSTLGSFDVGGTSSSTGVNRFIIGEKFCFVPHTFLYLYDSIIHVCIDETSLSHLKSSCFPCSLFCSDFGGGSPFTYWMKEHMDDYIDAQYIFFGEALWDMGSSTMSMGKI